MNTLKKWADVMAKNIGITLVLILAIVFFIWSCHGYLLDGLVTAFSALIIYIAASMLYKEFQKSTPSKPQPKKK